MCPQNYFERLIYLAIPLSDLNALYYIFHLFFYLSSLIQMLYTIFFISFSIFPLSDLNALYYIFISFSLFISLYRYLLNDIYISIYIHIYLSIDLSIYLSFYLCIYLSIHLSIYPSYIYIYREREREICLFETMWLSFSKMNVISFTIIDIDFILFLN